MSELQVTQTSGEAPSAAPSESAPTVNGDGSILVPVNDGRRLKLVYPGPLAQYKLVLAMGPEAADNTRFVSMCLPLIYLAAINDELIHLPTTLLQIEAIIGRLGHQGLAALKDGIALFDKTDTLEEAKK